MLALLGIFIAAFVLFMFFVAHATTISSLQILERPIFDNHYRQQRSSQQIMPQNGRIFFSPTG
jgi:hypothetical protein